MEEKSKSEPPRAMMCRQMNTTEVALVDVVAIRRERWLQNKTRVWSTTGKAGNEAWKQKGC